MPEGIAVNASTSNVGSDIVAREEKMRDELFPKACQVLLFTTKVATPLALLVVAFMMKFHQV